MNESDIQKARKLYALADPSRGSTSEESHTAWTKLHALLSARGGTLADIIQTNEHYARPEPRPSAAPPHRSREAWQTVPGVDEEVTVLWVRKDSKRVVHAGWLWLALATREQQDEWVSVHTFITELTLSTKQLSALQNLGVNLDTLVHGQLGHRLLSLLIARAKNQRATAGQLICIWERGGIDKQTLVSMSFEEAQRRIQR